MDSKKSKEYGMSIIDRLKDLKECKQKLFSFFLTAEGGVLDFCELPVHIKDKNEIYYSNVYPDNVENPWGVKIIDIKVSHMLNKFKNRANQSPKSNSNRYNENRKTQNKRIKRSKGTYCDLSTKRGCELLVDTGTYLTYIPRPMFNKIFRGYKL